MDHKLAQAILDTYQQHAQKITAEASLKNVANHDCLFRRLSSDTSIKQFVAVKFQQCDYLLIVLPTTGKTSEELFADEAELPFSQADAFIQSSRVFSQSCSAIPEVYAINAQEGMVLTACHGNETFFDALEKQSHSEQQLQTLLHNTIDWLIQLQNLNPTQHAEFIARQRRLGIKSLLLECQEFIDYGVKYFYQKNLSIDEKILFNKQFQALCEAIDQQQKLIIHRDMQSKNIMLDGEKIGIIDYQDCCLGPYTYDLASLLYDPYVSFDPDIVDDCMSYYFQQASEKRLINVSFAQVKKDCQLAGIQRLIKAAGRYMYIAEEKKQNTHVQFFLPAIERCLLLLDNFPEYSPLLELIGRVSR